MIINTKKGGTTPTGSLSITANGTYDVTAIAQAVVNVAGGDTIFPTASTVSTITITDDTYSSEGGSYRGTSTYLHQDFIPSYTDTTDHNMYFLIAINNTQPTMTTYKFYSLFYWRAVTSSRGSYTCGWSSRVHNAIADTGGSRSLYIGAGSTLKLIKVECNSVDTVVTEQGGTW